MSDEFMYPFYSALSKHTRTGVKRESDKERPQHWVVVEKEAAKDGGDNTRQAND